MPDAGASEMHSRFLGTIKTETEAHLRQRVTRLLNRTRLAVRSEITADCCSVALLLRAESDELIDNRVKMSAALSGFEVVTLATRTQVPSD